MREVLNKILLITPPFYRLYRDPQPYNEYPLGVGYLAGAIKTHTDWEVMVYNADFCSEPGVLEVEYLAGKGFYNYLNNLKDLHHYIWKEIISVLSEFKPSVVGISATSQTFASACNIASFVKDTFKDTIVVIGGPHASMLGAKILSNPDFNIVVKGEGEDTIVELLKTLESKGDLQKIKGISYRADGQIFENTPRELIGDLDSLSSPHEYAGEVLKDYEKYPLESFRNIMAIRGCPYNCFFCGSRNIWTQKVRFRSSENVIKEIQCLEKKGLRHFRFHDDTFGVNGQYINNLCLALIAHCPGDTWDCEMHVKLVNDSTVALMKRAGCRLIQIGIESGNNQILKDIRKGITIEAALSAAAIIKKHNISLQTFFMVGFPQETEETLQDTARAMKKVAADYLAYNIFMPYPGTEAFEFCKTNGLIRDDYDITLYNHQSPLNCFCLNISPGRFRILASKIEKMVDRRNKFKKIRRIFSLPTLHKIRKLGVISSFKYGIKLFLGRST